LRVASKGQQRRTAGLVEMAEHCAGAPSNPRGALGARRRGLREGQCRVRRRVPVYPPTCPVLS
jgi:hypothetical protein